MGRNISVDELSDVIQNELRTYSELAASQVKRAVRKAGNTVKQEIAAHAPKRTGTYANSWATKTIRDTAESLVLTVHSPKRYQLAHLLEHGHAKRGGGRTRAFPHIAPAEQKGIRELENSIEKALKRAK